MYILEERTHALCWRLGSTTLLSTAKQAFVERTYLTRSNAGTTFRLPYSLT